MEGDVGRANHAKDEIPIAAIAKAARAAWQKPGSDWSDIIYAALQAIKQEGFVIVRDEATEAMVEAIEQAVEDSCLGDQIWQAGVNAALNESTPSS